MPRNKINFPTEGDGSIFPLYNPSDLENIDAAVFSWLNEDMDLKSETNQGSEKVKVIWIGQERSFQSKTNLENKDEQGVFSLPLILIERTSITKDINRKGKYFANVPPVFDAKGGSITITKEINQEKTRGFASSHMNKKFRSEKLQII